MQHLKVSGAVRPLKWSLGVKWLIEPYLVRESLPSQNGNNSKSQDFYYDITLRNVHHILFL